MCNNHLFFERFDEAGDQDEAVILVLHLLAIGANGFRTLFAPILQFVIVILLTSGKLDGSIHNRQLFVGSILAHLVNAIPTRRAKAVLAIAIAPEFRLLGATTVAERDARFGKLYK